MRLQHFHQLRPHCLACRSDDSEFPLTISRAIREVDDDIREGLLCCSNSDCRYEYPVIDGIPFLVPTLPEFVAANADTIRARTDLSAMINSVLGDCCGPDAAFNITRQHLSSYGWCHYGDLDPELSDPNAGATVHALRALHDGRPRVSGNTIDLGCSVGRGTFELAESSGHLTLGVDVNIAMLRMAQEVMTTGRVRYPLRQVGLVYDECDFSAHFPMTQQVDFWACDVTCLPFSKQTFSHCLSLNTLDSVPSPAGLLQSIARIMAAGGTAQVACPYDWSSAVTPLPGWIGGHSQRAEHGGRSEAVLRQLLEAGELSRHLEVVTETDNIPWTVRTNSRSRMNYTLHATTLRRTD